MKDIVTLTGGGAAFAFRIDSAAQPRLLFWGAASAFDRDYDPPTPARPAAPDRIFDRLLFPVTGAGFQGEPALLAHFDSGSCFFSFACENIDATATRAVVRLADSNAGLRLALTYAMDAESGVLTAAARIENGSPKRLHVQRLNAFTAPLPTWATHTEQFYGGWSSEGRRLRLPIAAGKIERVQRGGRPGFDGGPFQLLCEETADEQYGRAAGLTIAHSGNHVLAVERFGDGGGQTFLAEWLFPGEIVLEPGAAYETPQAMAAVSESGIGGVSAAFHRFARLNAPPARRHRPVQFNTWEAAYFNISEKEANRLANEAASLGAERFVLDDGWFTGRRHDRAGLGDWTPDRAVFPDGLAPLAEHVNALGMEFGLWVEPEMVNEDSDLFRVHPDWVLGASGGVKHTARNQLVLDLTRPEVRDHLFAALDGLLRSAPIRYLKWDCNRDLFPAQSRGRPAASAQIAGLYALLDRLRDAHPAVALESCASGGGRIDFGVLRRADRFWTSDATDAIERVRIQRSASVFLPMEMLGAHVGPSPNPWTGRRLPMAFRCLVALFGHFGVELDPARLDAHERHVLTRAIALYKELRPWIADGQLVRCESADVGLDIQYILDANEERAALRILRTEEAPRVAARAAGIQALPRGARWRIAERRIDGADIREVVAIRSSESLAEAGFDLLPQHAGEGRLFILERT